MEKMFDVCKFSLNEMNKTLDVFEENYKEIMENSTKTLIVSYNVNLINSLKAKIIELNKNIEILEKNNYCDMISLESATNNLSNTIKLEYSKILKLAQESQELLNKENLSNDISEYQKKVNMLNNSFWEARNMVSTEDVKYPSATYEKLVKDYQNKYLQDNYNVTLEEIENFIENYQ